ncbi:MAG: hypothetical protein ACXWQO_18310, partial [Bdellovibrionota bacterium]
MALGFALNQEASAAVQVYVSYIDNETRAVLTSVLANQNKETVLAIGSGISPGSVFSSNYGGANATSNRTLLPNLN